MGNTSVKAKRLAVFGVLVGLLACLTLALAAPAQAIPTRATDVTAAADGNCLLGIDGTFYSEGKAAVLAKVNKIRKEACDQGVPDPRNSGRKLTSADYVEMRWSADLERIAQTRAAEASICESHSRPNGDSCFGAYAADDINSGGETLAWNYSASMIEGIEQWYDEKADWVQQNDAVTGHYTAMINPNNTHIGLGSFASNQSWACIAGEYLNASWYGGLSIPEDEIGVTGAYRQIVEVQKASIAGVGITGNTTLKGAAKRTYMAVVNVNLASVWGGTQQVAMVPLGTVTWKSGTPTTATVSATGQVVAKKCGTTKLAATVADLGKSASVTLKVIPAATSLKKVSAKKKALKVTWSKPAALAMGYEIRYSEKKSMKGAKTVTVKGAAKGAKTIKKLKAKKKYYVQVRSFAKVNGKMYYSAWSGKKSKKTK